MTQKNMKTNKLIKPKEGNKHLTKIHLLNTTKYLLQSKTQNNTIVVLHTFIRSLTRSFCLIFTVTCSTARKSMTPIFSKKSLHCCVTCPAVAPCRYTASSSGQS